MDRAIALSRLRPGEDWGPCVAGNFTYAEFAAKWRGASAVPTEQEIIDEWAAFEAEGGIAGLQASQERSQALADILDGSGLGKLVRGLALAVLDEMNAHALKINEILDAADAALSLADFKTRMALIADYPQRTKANLVNAVESKISSGDADSGS